MKSSVLHVSAKTRSSVTSFLCFVCVFFVGFRLLEFLTLFSPYLFFPLDFWLCHSRPPDANRDPSFLFPKASKKGLKQSLWHPPPSTQQLAKRGQWQFSVAFILQFFKVLCLKTQKTKSYLLQLITKSLFLIYPEHLFAFQNINFMFSTILHGRLFSPSATNAGD